MKDKPVILIVDDQPQNIELLEAHLVPEGYDIVKAANGEEALGNLSGSGIDLILLDVMMPGIDGFEVTRRVRQGNNHRLLPIILVTALRETEDRVKGIEAGCDEFISKPVDKIELLARIRSLLKVKAYNDLMSNYRQELESEVTRRTEELKHALENLQQDITERKRVEEALKETLADLERSNRDLEQFAYVASHDLQEPLRMVASYTQLIAKRYKDKLDADANEFIGFAVNGARRMQGMIDDLLSYSRIGTRRKPFETIDWTALLNQVLTNLTLAIEETGAVITHDPLPIVRGDESQLIQLFQNLIGNAIKFKGEEAPHIHLSATHESGKTIDEGRGTIDPLQTQLSELNGGWVFSVKDNGIGIDPQYKERIFLTFQRLHGREGYPGNGIGLAVCKKIVEYHKGRIWMESEPGKGSIFYFTIPETGVLK